MVSYIFTTHLHILFNQKIALRVFAEQMPDTPRKVAEEGAAAPGSWLRTRHVLFLSVLAGVVYASAVASFHVTQYQLHDTVGLVREQHATLVGRLSAESVRNQSAHGTCEGVLEQVDKFADTELPTLETPVISLSIIFVGCVTIGLFFFEEFNVALNKEKVTFTAGELIGYRLDHHFSASQLAKPVLLLAVTFVLILTSTLALALVSGESLSAAMWRSWTFGERCWMCLPCMHAMSTETDTERH